MLEISFRQSNNEKLKNKYLQENRVQSVRGGKDYKLSDEAKKYLKGKGTTDKSVGFFKRLFWCCGKRARGSKSRERDIKKAKKKKKISTFDEEEKTTKKMKKERNSSEDDESENKEGGSTKPNSGDKEHKDPDMDIEDQKSSTKIPVEKIKESMTEMVKEAESQETNPLDYRFRKIINLSKADKKTKDENKSEEEENSQNDRESESGASKSENKDISEEGNSPSKPKVNNFVQNSTIQNTRTKDAKIKEKSTIHFEPTFWPSKSQRYFTLEECLDYYTELELLNDRKNLYQCENCTLLKYGKKSKRKFESPAIKRSMILELPCNLIINLKRFTHGFMSFQKSRKTVLYPLFLKMDKYTIEECDKDDEERYTKYSNTTMKEQWKHKHIYELYGIVTHSGSMSGGHYIAFVCYKLGKDRNWFYCSDSSVRKVSEKVALDAEAYILFYRRVT